ncbi:amino acid racemase [Polaromonas sp. P1(28)-8]|nr:amino acid racemase [Polaromonas sp. P1(28)-8]
MNKAINQAGMAPMLGVLGGMGPAAGAYFAYRLALLTDVQSDQEHLPVLLINDPKIPDRSEFALGRGLSPMPAMRRNLQFLESSGCSCAVIPCNTAHYWYPDLQMSVKMPLIHIVSSVVENLHARGIDGGRIGLLGTPATVNSGLYKDKLTNVGYTVLPYTEDDVLQLCVRPIQAVKQNRLREAGTALADSVRVLYDRGATAVILGCTELPIAHASLSQEALELPVVDSIDSLAVCALNHFRFHVKQPNVR